MDHEMIERCAEAYGGCKLSEWHPEVQKTIKETVVNIIKAMREPTEHMLNTEDVHPSCHTCGGHKEGWINMIDAIIGDK